ncbi:phosphoribosyl-AMP cyclohydrolase [Hyphomicrobium sp. CS1BSMeth3]|uniref:phosphoribosyl-AMP cyclohydrolase n=1 Tax=Hyphomicrobium sp. CS1BSMeth3 TaxID=1892844 RepID=UPI0009309069|nr:phosphoribosyl-AMP cyclohydrolase [Hyphomicrobium sp. CS1BSMeth3]
MSSTASGPFAARGSARDIEEGLAFTPKFDDAGLLAAVATDADTGDVLMFAWMDAEAVARTIETGHAHFYSRSRGRQWKKGEESGNVLEVVEMRTDCDQDAIWLKVRVAGAGAACHTGRKSCFYRAIPLRTASPADVKMQGVGGEPLFDPAAVYPGKPKP